MANTGGRSVREALALACLLALVGSGPARGEHHAYENGTFDRSPAEGFPGTVIQVSGTGCIENGTPYETASVWLYNSRFDAPLRHYPVRSNGTWGGEFAVPVESPPGDYQLEASCRADDMVFPIGYQSFRVLDPWPPTSAPPTTSAAPTTSVATTPPLTSRATSAVVGPSGATSSSSTPSTTAPVSPPSQPVADTASSAPAVAAEKPRRRVRDDDAAPYLASVVTLLVATAAGAAWRIRRRRT